MPSYLGQALEGDFIIYARYIFSTADLLPISSLSPSIEEYVLRGHYLRSTQRTHASYLCLLCLRSKSRLAYLQLLHRTNCRPVRSSILLPCFLTCMYVLSGMCAYGLVHPAAGWDPHNLHDSSTCLSWVGSVLTVYMCRFRCRTTYLCQQRHATNKNTPW